MVDNSTIRNVLEQVVDEVFSAGVPGLRNDITQHVLQQAEPLLAPIVGDVFTNEIPKYGKEVTGRVLQQLEPLLAPVVRDVLTAGVAGLRASIIERALQQMESSVAPMLNDVFAAGVAGLRSQIIQRVLQQMGPLLAPPDETPTDRLQGAVAAIHDANTQSDVLQALVDGTSIFCGRAALLVVRASSAMGWQARGFRENDAIKLVSLDLNSGMASQAFQQRAPVEGQAEQFDPKFIGTEGAPINGKCLLVPLVVRDKVPALIYADSGTDPKGELDASAIGVLAQTAGKWIELVTLRKSAGIAVPASPVAPPSVSVAAAPTSPAPAGPSASDPQPVATPTPPVPLPTPSTPAPVVSAPAMAAEDEEAHRKARRFAKLLVDEIKLYNQAKVAEGRQNSDLYDRLKEDIEKSRASYDKRYSQTPLAQNDYFTLELIRNLADNNPNLLGTAFSR